MTTTNQDVKTKYELFDGCYGVVTERCRAGAYLQLDDGEEAFAYRFGNLFPGTKVLCTVLREAKEARRMLVSVDAVLEYAGFAA